MKKTILTVLIIFQLCPGVFCRPPQGLTHQAVIRNAAGDLVTNSYIGLRVSILKGSAQGEAVFIETHMPRSNAQGLVTFFVGQGVPVLGYFPFINWETGTYFLQTEADPLGGNNYSITSTMQLMSVLRSFHATKTGRLESGSYLGEIKYWNGAEWVGVNPGAHHQVLRFCNGVPTWGPCPETYEVVFNVDMSTAQEFDPETDAVYITGSMFNWAVPGTLPKRQAMVRSNGSMTWTATLPLEEGIYEYKYFINDGWGGGEWGGPPNRRVRAFESTLTNDVWGLAPEYHMLTLLVNPSEAGTVEGSDLYEAGEQIAITINANEGWWFMNWTDESHQEVSAQANFVFTMPEAATTLNANFVSIENVSTLVELRSKPADGSAYRFTGNAVIVAMDDTRNRKFIQDATAAIMLDDDSGIITTSYALYDVITNVAGQLVSFFNMIQLQPLATTGPALANTPVDPLLLEMNEVTNADQAKLIRFEGVFFDFEGDESMQQGDLFENLKNYTLTDGQNSFVLRTHFQNADYIGEEIPAGKIDVNGIIWQHNDVLQLIPRFLPDFSAYPVVVTHPASNVAPNWATLDGTVTHEGSSEVTDRGFFWGTEPNPEISGTKLPVGFGAGEFSTPLFGLEANTHHYFIAYATSSLGTMYGSQKEFVTPGTDGWPCFGIPTVTDQEQNIYNTVMIGDQCWLKENLKTTRYQNGTSISNPTNYADWVNNTTGAYAWYNNDIGWKDSYGALYSWHAVNNSNGLCPVGWRVPTDADWSELTSYIETINNETPGNQLKSCRQQESPLGGECDTSIQPRWNLNADHYGTDDFGFSGLPGGAFHIYFQNFSGIGESTWWWSSTEAYSTQAFYRSLSGSSGDVTSNDYPPEFGFSVRCIKNEE